MVVSTSREGRIGAWQRNQRLLLLFCKNRVCARWCHLSSPSLPCHHPAFQQILFSSVYFYWLKKTSFLHMLHMIIFVSLLLATAHPIFESAALALQQATLLPGSGFLSVFHRLGCSNCFSKAHLIVNSASQTQFQTLCASFKISWQCEWPVINWTNEMFFHSESLFCKGKMRIFLDFNYDWVFCWHVDRGLRTLITSR